MIFLVPLIRNDSISIITVSYKGRNENNRYIHI